MYAPWFKYDSGLDTSFIYLCIQWYYLWAILSFSGWIAFHPFGMKWNLMCIHSFSFADFNRRTTVRSHFHFVYMHKMFNILCSVWVLNDESTALDNVRLPMAFSNIFSTFQSQKRFYIFFKKWVIFIFHIFFLHPWLTAKWMQICNEWKSIFDEEWGLMHICTSRAHKMSF